MMNQEDIIDNGDGTCDVLCETIEEETATHALLKDWLIVHNRENAIWSVTPPSERKRGVPIEEKAIYSNLTIGATREEVIAALEAGRVL